MKGTLLAAKRANGKSRKCRTCPFMKTCTPDLSRLCSESFVEGFRKGVIWAERQMETITGVGQKDKGHEKGKGD